MLGVPAVLDELQAAGVLAGDDEMYLQLDDRRQRGARGRNRCLVTRYMHVLL